MCWEALTIQDQLFETDAARWLLTFATHTDRLWSAQRRDQAAMVIAERLDKLLGLITLADPVLTDPDPVTVLRVSARRLDAVGRAADAVQLAEAAVDAARHAAQSAVAAAEGSHRLALALSDLGAALAGYGRLDDALDSWDEAADL